MVRMLRGKEIAIVGLLVHWLAKWVMKVSIPGTSASKVTVCCFECRRMRLSKRSNLKAFT